MSHTGSVSTPDGERLAVIGAGTMGAGIAESAVAAGIAVLLVDTSHEAVARGVERVAAGLERDVARGRRTAGEREAALALLATATELAACANASVVIEAVFEDLALKRQIFATLDQHCAPEALLATNTSALGIAQIAAATSKPGRVVGMHFFNPVPRMRLVEVIGGSATAAATLDRAQALARLLGKTPIVARDLPGFVVNRVARPFYLEALRLVEAGAAAVQVDAALRGLGFPMGPCELMDLIGLDVNLATSESLWQRSYGQPRFRPSSLQRGMVDAGLLGRKTGQGFYHYGDTSQQAAPTAPASGEPFTVVGDPGLAAALGLPADGAGLPMLALADEQFLAGSGYTLGLRRLSPRAGTVELVGTVGEATQNSLTVVVQAAGLHAAWLPDLPGGAGLRTIAALVNEAAFAFGEGLASAEAIDQAMQLGANYPQGPFAWAAELGPPRLLRLLDALRSLYGDAYCAAPLLRQSVLNCQPLG